MKTFTEWVSGLRANYTCKVECIAFSQSMEWAFQEGALRHRTGRFFSIGAFAGAGEAARPMIDQPEIGILGFALHRERSGGLEILCHAKPEPGNTPVIQVAPSFQATQSNFERLHGGERQVLHDWFLGPGSGGIVSTSLQTETSEFFFRKRNRNVVRMLMDRDLENQGPLPPQLRWHPLEATLEHIGVPCLFNTDARSVLVSADWHQLAAEGRPFQTRGLDPELEALLAESFSAMDSPSQLPWSGVENWIGSLKGQARAAVNRVPLDSASEWEITSDRMVPRSHERYHIRQISADMPGRERAGWDQPILAGSGEGVVTLMCSVLGGMLHFLLSADPSDGSFHGFEINAFQSGPCSNESRNDRERRTLEVIQDLKQTGKARELAASRLSDEGGRFLRMVSQYEVLRVPGNVLEKMPRKSAVWLTLGQFKGLVDAGELVSSEARSALSLLLRYL